MMRECFPPVYASFILAVLVAAPARSAPAPARPKWKVEKSGGRVVARLESNVVNYGAADNPVVLALACSLDDRRLQAYFATPMKTMGTFTVRFDGEPAAEHGAPGDRFHDPVEGSQLRVADAKAADFVRDVRTHRRLLLRHEFIGRFYDATFDLAGLAGVIAPLRQACDLPEVSPPTPAPAAAAAAAGGPKESHVGNWVVRETVSRIDDKPRIIMTASDKVGNVSVVIRCQEGALEAYLYSGAILDSDRQTQRTTVTVALDGGEPSTYREPASSSQAVFFPDTSAFVKSLSNHRSIRITTTPYTPRRTMAIRTTDIDIADFDKAFAPVAAACPGK
jgi:hypothetical protein